MKDSLMNVIHYYKCHNLFHIIYIQYYDKWQTLNFRSWINS